MAMKKWPILMRPEMVRAILAGKKTVTRRLDRRWLKAEPGDLIWVKEPWAVCESLDGVKPLDLATTVDVEFLADGARSRGRASFDRGRVRSPLHLPMSLARIWCVVVSVREEYLRDITDAEAIREGIQSLSPFAAMDGKPVFGIPGQRPGRNRSTAREAFRVLWKTIHGRDGGFGWWSSDMPVVVVRIEFRQAERSEIRR